VYDEPGGAAPATKFLRMFATIFTQTILSMTFVGMLIAGMFGNFEASVHHGIFGYGFAGLPFASLVQVAGLSLVMTFWCFLLTSPKVFARLRFLRFAVLVYLATMLSASAFAVIFRWLPADLPAWTLLVAFGVASFAFAIVFIFAVLKNRAEARRYGELLENYKARREPPTGNG